jgi:hypothetical protein
VCRVTTLEYLTPHNITDMKKKTPNKKYLYLGFIKVTSVSETFVWYSVGKFELNLNLNKRILFNTFAIQKIGF